jgi:NAD+ synthase (glutamine-hydrolysing)
MERGEITWRGQVELPEEAVISPFQAGPVSLHSPATNPELSDLEEVYAALCLGVRDYVKKNGFASVIIAVSGGIDSALTAAIACDALGAQKVRGVYMPSQFSSQDSAEDAAELARNLGFDLLTIPIEQIVREYAAHLEPLFRGRAPDITEENLQARIRGTLIMALSNKFGYLVLATGNKSEFSTGYATLYGDMAGGLCVLKDVSKTLVYQLARYRNSLPDGVKIPQRTITRAPSAELKPNQLDTDSLPEYDVLDPIVEMYVEEDKSDEEIIAAGYDADTVRKVVRLIHLAEYKRRQGAIGIRITPRAFGRDRRMPITNAFREWEI